MVCWPLQTLGLLVWRTKKYYKMLKRFSRIFVWPWKMVSINVPYLYYQPMGEKIKTWTLRFPVKEKPNMEKALFDWPVVGVWCQSEVSKVLVHEDFSPELSLNQPKDTRVCILSINQSSRSISVRSLFPFCSRVFISRSYENRSKSTLKRLDVELYF